MLARTQAPLTRLQNEIAEPIQKLIGKLPGWDHIPALFEQIYDSRSTTDRPWNGKVSFKVNNQPLHWNLSDRSLRPQSLCDGENEKAILQVFDAATNPRLAEPMDQVQSRLIFDLERRTSLTVHKAQSRLAYFTAR